MDFDASMFESIQESFQDQKNGWGGVDYRNFLKFEVDKTYLIRLLPYIEDPSKTFVGYHTHGWKSVVTHVFQQAVCLSDFGERCPGCEERYNLFSIGTDDAKTKAGWLRKKERHLCNAYVIDDPTAPENNGKVRIIRYGSQLHEKIFNAIAKDGKDRADIGERALKLDANGCTLKIEVTSKSGGKSQYSDYTTSRFMFPSEIPGMTPEKIDEILGSTFNLKDFIKLNTFAEIKAMIQAHLYGEMEDPMTFPPANDGEEDDIPMEFSGSTETKEKAKSAPEKSASVTTQTEELVKKIEGKEVNQQLEAMIDLLEKAKNNK